jgi:predicted flap endonuclease-1-like 5' DNA nuclease
VPVIESVPVPEPTSAPEPAPAGRRRRTPSKAPARAAPAPSPEPAAEPDGWQPVRPGLSNPRTWLGTTAPNGSTYREDDLERIHGVGPYLARRLRDAGIVTWRQVAEWDDDDMTLVSRLVGSFPDRIRREDWPASARALHEEAYGETLP